MRCLNNRRKRIDDRNIRVRKSQVKKQLNRIRESSRRKRHLPSKRRLSYKRGRLPNVEGRGNDRLLRIEPRGSILQRRRRNRSKGIGRNREGIGRGSGRIRDKLQTRGCRGEGRVLIARNRAIRQGIGAIRGEPSRGTRHSDKIYLSKLETI